MAGEKLESSLVLKDEASEVLKDLAEQAELTGDALASVQDALRGLDAAGKVTIKADIRADETKTPGAATKAGEAWKPQEPPRMEDESWNSFMAMVEETDDVRKA